MSSPIEQEAPGLFSPLEEKHSNEYRRREYLCSQLNLLTIVTRFGKWLVSDINSETKYGKKKEYQISVPIEELTEAFGDYTTEVALLYARWLTNKEPIDHKTEQFVWSGQTLGRNPLEEVYTAWQTVVGSQNEKSVEGKLKFSMSIRQNALQGKQQFFPEIPEWLIRPWLADRENFGREDPDQLLLTHCVSEGIHWFDQNTLEEIRKAFIPYIRKCFPKGAVLFANLASALPDTALIAHFIKHSRIPGRKDISIAVYQLSPNIEETRSIWLPSTEYQFMQRAINRGLPIILVDSFASTGQTVVDSLEYFREETTEVPLYFLLTTSGKNVIEHIQWRSPNTSIVGWLDTPVRREETVILQYNF